VQYIVYHLVDSHSTILNIISAVAESRSYRIYTESTAHHIILTLAVQCIIYHIMLTVTVLGSGSGLGLGLGLGIFYHIDSHSILCHIILTVTVQQIISYHINAD
jgi:hypothetical protein